MNGDTGSEKAFSASPALWAQNATGNSLRSNVVAVTIPASCSGPPEMPADVVAYRVGRTVFVSWAPGDFGAAGILPTASAR